MKLGLASGLTALVFAASSSHDEVAPPSSTSSWSGDDVAEPPTYLPTGRVHPLTSLSSLFALFSTIGS